MRLRTTILLAIGLLFFWVVGILLQRSMGISGPRFFNDNYDRQVYYERGSWIVRGGIPYRDTISEYPQIPTYLFGLPFLGLSLIKPMDQVGYWLYSSAFSLLMLLFLFLLVNLLFKYLPERKNLALLLLLPGYLYFVYNRFDILPAFLCVISYLFLLKDRSILAAIMLGIASLTKWYPALLLPVYLIFQYKSTGKLPWWMLISYILTCVMIILPTFITGGLEATLVPYQFHFSRGLEQVSLPTLVGKFISLITEHNPLFLIWTFLILQFAPVLIIFFVKIDSYTKVLLSSNFIIACFILFSRIYSPQWLLWLIPFLILSAANRRDIAWIIIGGIGNYIAFPVLYDQYGPESIPMLIMGIFQIIFITRIIINSIGKLSVQFDPVRTPLHGQG